MKTKLELKRYAIKYVRDKAKSDYQKDKQCQICGTYRQLEFHHYYTLSLLLRKWQTATRRKDEDVLEWREHFIEEHEKELYGDAVTLCKKDHTRLHSIYGRNPSLGTALKQIRWVEIQRDKENKE